MNLIQKLTGSLSSLVRLVLGVVLIGTGLILAVLFGWCRVYVDPGECLVRIAKFGDEPPAEMTVVERGQKGIQRETLGPGRHFMNPLLWETKAVPLVKIEAGSPETWTWAHTVSRLPAGRGVGANILAGEMPEVGVLTRKSGKRHPQGNTVVDMDSGYQGIIREVLTPGEYRINPYEYDVEIEPALVIPAGFVGVVTNQIGEQPAMIEVPDLPNEVADPTDKTPATPSTKMIRPLASPGQRGTLRDVLPPGVYYLNPNVTRVKITEVGFNEFSQLATSKATDTIRFPSKSGFDIELGVTVVWGLHPKNAAAVINEFGTTTEVLEKVIKPQLRSICRNQGSLYEARDFIQGEKREEFQHVLTTALRDVCAQKNIELLLALISTIDVYSSHGQSASEEADLKTEIQDSFIAIERQLTNIKLQETAKKKALLEEAKKKVDVSRETIQAQTRLKVATTLADGQRKAAEVEAQGRLQVATIEQQIAAIEAQKVELMGKAQANVEKLKQQAEADGKKLLVDALGSGEAYNLYTFASGFQPESIKLFFAGPGTFWTDLKKIEELGAAEVLKQAAAPAAKP